MKLTMKTEEPDIRLLPPADRRLGRVHASERLHRDLHDVDAPGSVFAEDSGRVGTP